MVRKRYALILVALLACFTIALPGCRKTVPVQSFTSPMPLVEREQDKAIEGAIIRGGAVTGWEIVPVRPGLMEGTIVVRGKHTATVDITYNDNTYSIKYKSSVGLKHANGKIHPSYNTWVATLDKNIRRELASLTR